jgi:hypothetical protein
LKAAWEAAIKFNQLVKDGKTEELVMAPVIEDIEVREPEEEEKKEEEEAGDDKDEA